MPLSKIVAKSITDDTITTDQIADTSVHGRRNLIINGAMQVWQRGTTQTFQNNGAYVLDRFAYRRGGTISTTTFDVSQEDTSGLPEFPHCIQAKVQDAALSDPNSINSQMNQFKYTVEGQDIQHWRWGTSEAQPIAISFYVKASVAGTYCWQIRHTDSAKNYVAEYTISSADTWEKKTIYVAAPSTSEVQTATPNDKTVGLTMQWVMSGNVTGTSDQRISSANTWTADGAGGELAYTANQTNNWTTVDNIFQLTGVQVEVGDKVTPFEHRSFEEELWACKRYYNKIGGSGDWEAYPSQVASSTGCRASVHWDRRMRTRPSITWDTGSTNYVQARGNNYTITGLTTAHYSDKGAIVDAASTSMTQGDGSIVLFNTNNQQEFDAEL